MKKWRRICDLTNSAFEGPTLRGDHLGEIRFSPDGTIVGPGEAGGMARFWDVVTGRPVASLPAAGYEVLGTEFSPDGRLIVRFGSSQTADIWDVASGRPWGVPLRHHGKVRAASFSPDGRLIVTASHDSKVQLWDVATCRPKALSLRRRREAWDASFSPDGRLVVTASEDRTAQVSEVGRGDLAPIPDTSALPLDAEIILEQRSFTPKATFNADRSRVLQGGTPPARLIDFDTGQPVGRPMTHRWSWLRAVAISPDGRHIATSSHRRYRELETTSTTCQIWDAETGRPASPILPHINHVAALAFRPDGGVLATGDYSSTVHLWDVRTGAMIGRPFSAGSIVLALAFSPDGRLLAAGTAEPRFNQAVLWNLRTGPVWREAVRFAGWATVLAFSPDSTDLAVGAADGWVNVIENATGRVRAALRHDGPVHGVAFSPDGRLILTSNRTGEEGAIRLWDARTGEAVSPVISHSREPLAPPVFSPDGAVFATAFGDRSVQLWDVATVRPIGATIVLRGDCRSLAFRPDGKALLTMDVRERPILACAPARRRYDRRPDP